MDVCGPGTEKCAEDIISTYIYCIVNCVDYC